MENFTKLPYIKPTLTSVGSVAELTNGSNIRNQSDNHLHAGEQGQNNNGGMSR